MNLKNEIDKTNLTKEKSKKAKNNINNVIVKNGGNASNTLNDISENLDLFVKSNLKKVATIDINRGFSVNTNDYNADEFEITLPLDFTPSEVFVEIYAQKTINRDDCVHTISTISHKPSANGLHLRNGYFNVEKNKNGIKIIVNAQGYAVKYFTVKKIIAIE